MKREKRIFWFKVEDIWFETKYFKNSKRRISCLHSNSVLDKREYDFVIPGKTFVLDISRGVDDIFAGFEASSCRYAIKKAIKDGIQVKKVGGAEDEIIEYLNFENEFRAERKIPSVCREDLSELDIFYALSSDAEYLGGCAFFVSTSDNLVRYKYGSTKHKSNANEIILWNAIQYYHEKMLGKFDFGGVTITEDKDSYYYHNYKFKRKFGGELVDSFMYFKFRGFFKLLFCCYSVMLKVFFKGDFNKSVNWLHRIGLVD